MAIRKPILRSQLENPYEGEFDSNDSIYQDRARQFKFELKSDSHHTQAAFQLIAPDILHIRQRLQPISEPHGIDIRGPKLMDDTTATLLERASNVGLELNASKAVLAATSAVAVFAFLAAGPLYGLLAALPALIAALSFRVLQSLSNRARRSVRR